MPDSEAAFDFTLIKTIPTGTRKEEREKLKKTPYQSLQRLALHNKQVSHVNVSSYTNLKKATE